ncbi:MAG: GspH/FimT family protein [Nitrospinaceae bacterium]
MIELILVLFFMALVAGLVTPMVMSTLDRIELQSSARRIASAMAYARSQAVTLKTAFVFEGDLESNQYWVRNTRTDKSSPTTVLDERVRFIQSSNDREFESDEVFRIKFFPQGNSSGGTLRVEAGDPEDSEEFYVITIDAVTGKAVITQEER